MKSFFLHEDDWGMIALLPAENYSRSLEVAQEAREFGEAHFDGNGWTDVYVIPEAKVSIAEREIPLSELKPLFENSLTQVDEFLTGYSSWHVPVSNGFAFLGEQRGGFYGTQKEGFVTQLNYLGGYSDDPALIAGNISLLSTLGHKYNLILADWWQDKIVNLQNSQALEQYFQDEDD